MRRRYAPGTTPAPAKLQRLSDLRFIDELPRSAIWQGARSVSCATSPHLTKLISCDSNLQILSSLPANVQRPSPSATGANVGIVHLGIGAFHPCASGGVHRRRDGAGWW